MINAHGYCVVALVVGWSTGAAVAIEPGPLGIIRESFPPPSDSTGWVWSAAADVNADGLSDIYLFSDDGAHIGLLLATPDGFGTPITAAFDEGVDPLGIDLAVGDADADGLLDLYIMDPAQPGGWVVHFLGDRLSEPRPLDTAGQSAFRVPSRVSDVDGDGRADLVFRTRDNRLLVQLSADSATPFLFDAPAGLADVDAHTDLTGDGLADLVVRFNGTHDRAIYTEPTGLGLGEPIMVSPPGSVSEIADLTGDGLADLIGGVDGDMFVLINQGGAVFSETVIPISDTFEGLTVIGDFDGSGLPDAVVFTRDYPVAGLRLRWLWPDPITGYGRDRLACLEGARGDVTFRDVDADGVADLQLIQSHVVTTHLNRGRAGVPPVGITVHATQDGPRHVLARDLDNDDAPELLVSTDVGVWRFRRTTAGGYDSARVTPPEYTFMSLCSDLDLDGHDELIVSASFSGLLIHRGVPGGFAKTPTRYGFGPGSRLVQIAVGDLDSDTRPDIVAADAGLGRIHLFMSGSSGLPLYTGSIHTDAEPESLALYDVDGDGTTEILSGGRTFPGIRVWELTDDQWAEADPIPTADDVFWLTVVDLDDDGYQDIIPVHWGPSMDLEILYGGPDGLTSSCQIACLRTGGAVECAVADVNADGRSDILLSPYGTGSSLSLGISVYLQVAPRVFEFASAVPGATTSGLAASDVNQDGVIDIVGAADVGVDGGLLQVHYGHRTHCLADLAPPFGALDFFDVSAFLTAYNAQDPAADLAEPFGTFDSFDVSAFLDAFATGCP